WASGTNAHPVLRPDVHQPFRVLGQRNFDVFLLQFFDSRKVRAMCLPSQKCSYASTSREQADGEPCKKRYCHKYGGTPHRASPWALTCHHQGPVCHHSTICPKTGQNDPCESLVPGTAVRNATAPAETAKVCSE